MKTLKARTVVTSFTIFIFLVLGGTGVLMFFHILDNYTKLIHEILGLAFVCASIFHIKNNWKSVSKYFPNKTFKIIGVLVLSVSTILVFIGGSQDDIQRDLIEKLVKAPISHSFIVLNEDFNTTKLKLEKKGVIIGESDTIEEISTENKIPLEDLVELIIL